MCDAYATRAAVYVCLACAGIFVSWGHAAPPVVSERAQLVGLDGVHATVFQGPDVEFMGGGGAVGDFDNDGDQDLFVVGGSAGVDRLYINDGSGHFTEQGAGWGVARTHQGTGAAVGDYDNDGDQDLYVTSLGGPFQREPGWNVLYRNNGDGSFTDVTSIAGVGIADAFQGDTFSGAFGDFDLDGDLDLAAAGWLGGSRLFRNEGDGTFSDVTLSALDVDMSTNRGFAPRFVDMDGDRYPELLWVADFFTSHYFANNTDGTFSTMTPGNGTGLDSNGMGNTIGDYDGDGHLDWYVSSRINHAQSNGSGNMLYMGGPKPHVFSEESVARGANFGYWGWGVVSIDINHDGYLDIYETNGFDGSFETDPAILYLNDGTGSFSDHAPVCGMDVQSAGRGLLSADFDSDGDQDVVMFNNRQPMVYYMNEIDTADGANAITVDFDTSAVADLAPDGFGTRVELFSAGGSQVRYMDGGSNYLSQSELSVHFGIGADESADLTIKWANGGVTNLVGVTPGRYTITALSCPADLSGDGNLNFFDVSAFLALYQGQHPQGDINGDGQFNFFDVSAFLSAYQGGCP
jgi:hypothetical protein